MLISNSVFWVATPSELSSLPLQAILRPVIEKEVVEYKQTIDSFCGATDQRSPRSIIQNNSYFKSRVSLKLTSGLVCVRSLALF